ncbi:glycosyltransferase family 9 protein [Moritella sp. 24]|nr:glycosyltransferase family 9 protein [Moritella sp. 24]QUM78447.1 glycosyltransferase family 9 protein [Moritella sp. 24]
MNMTPPQSICILRFSAIGDVCHAVAAVQAIQRHYPLAKITWIIGKVEAMLVGDIPNVEFIILDKKAGFNGYLSLYKQLNHRKFDVLLNMQVSLRANISSLCIRAKQRWGFDKYRAREGQWLVSNRQIPAQDKPHVLDGFMAFAEAIGVPKQEPTWNIPISREDSLWALSQISHTQKNFIICPAASKASKNWTAIGYAEVADYMEKQNFQVSICGGHSDIEKELTAEIIKLSNANINNLVAKTTLKQLLAIIKNADLVLAPDTGPTHMSTTVGTPVVGLYALHNPGRTGPYNNLDDVVEVYTKHMPNANWGTKSKDKELMLKITVEQVKNKLNPLIDRITKC